MVAKSVSGSTDRGTHPTLLVDLLPGQIRYWTIIVPSYTITVVLLAYLTYAALMAYNTPELTSLSLLTGGILSSSTALPRRNKTDIPP